MGYSPWGRKESDTTERLHFTSLHFIYWNGLPCPPPGNLSDPGIEPTSLMSPVLVGGFFTTSTNWEACPLFHSRHRNCVLCQMVGARWKCKK